MADPIDVAALRALLGKATVPAFSTSDSWERTLAERDLTEAARDALPALLDENERLKAALEPFASVANDFDPEFSDSQGGRAVEMTIKRRGLSVTATRRLSDFRNARAALGGQHE